jgi:hypothetical protein
MSQMKRTAKDGRRPNNLIHEVNNYTQGDGKYAKEQMPKKKLQTPRRSEQAQSRFAPAPGSEISIKNEAGEPAHINLSRKHRHLNDAATRKTQQSSASRNQNKDLPLTVDATSGEISKFPGSQAASKLSSIVVSAQVDPSNQHAELRKKNHAKLIGKL